MANKYDIMVGIGCGYPPDNTEKKHTHHLPLDIIHFLIGSDEIRKGMHIEKGVVIFADIDVNFLRAQYRKSMLTNILEVTGLSEHWDLVPQTALASERAELPPITLSDNVPLNSRGYFKNELGDVALSLNSGGGKVGWALGKRRGVPVGGEVYFDKEIQNNWPGQYQFTYLEPGLGLNKHTGINKCPYLVRTDELSDRICLTKKESDIERELSKIRSRKLPAESKVRISSICREIGIEENPNDIESTVKAILNRFTIAR